MSRRKILCCSLISLRSFCVILGLSGTLVLEILAESNLFVETIEGNNLAEFINVGWEGYATAKHYDTPSKFKNNLAALDSETVDGVWVENNPSPGSFVNFNYVFDTSDICDMNYVDLSIKYYAELATAYFYPCDSSSSSEYCYLGPSNANQWSNFMGRLRVPLDKIEIGGMLVPGGYIIFEEITITHDGKVGDDCITTTSTTEATTEGTTDGTEETADTEETPPTTTPITTTDDGSTTEEPTTETTTTEEPEITEPPPVTTTDDPTDAPTTETTTDSTETTTDSTETTTDSTETTTDSTETTTHSTETTTDSTETPTDSTETPTDSTETPTDTTEPPTGTTEPPTGTTEPPTGTTEPPTGTTEPPTGTTEPITGTTEPPTGTTEPPTGTTEPPTGTTEPPTGTTTINPIVSSNPTSSTSLSSETTEASSISTSPLTPSSSTALTPPQPPPTVPTVPTSSTPASDTGGGLSLQDILLYIILPISVGVVAFLGTVFYFGFRGYRLAGLGGKGGATSKLNPAARTARQNDINPQSSRMGPPPISQPNTSAATAAQGLSPHPVYAAPTPTNSNMAGANLHPTHGNVNPVSRSVALNIPNDEVDRLSDRSSFNSRGDRPLIYTGEYQGEFSKYLPRMRPKFD